MRVKKLALSVALAGILGATSAAAETNGAFVGVQVAKAKVDTDMAFVIMNQNQSRNFNTNESGSSFRYGILGGYKQFFTEKFGLRYYGVLDFGTNSKHKIGINNNNGEFINSRKISTWNINANVDALYNFVSNDSLDFGVFGGLSLGYANHKAKEVADSFDFDAKDNPIYKDLTAKGFDLGINFGLRTNIAKNHGIELYSRFSVLKQKGDYAAYLEGNNFTITGKTTLKVSQPYAVGLRYSFSF